VDLSWERSVSDKAAGAENRQLEGEQGMGASAHDIASQTNEARDRIDENLGALEQRATSNAVRFGKIAAIASAAALVAGGFVLYRHLTRLSLKDRLQGTSLESLRDLADEMSAHLKERVPSVKLTVNGIIRRVTPAIRRDGIRRPYRQAGSSVEPTR
jgi:hypothetical protein